MNLDHLSNYSLGKPTLDNVVSGMYNINVLLPELIKFEWDKGNIEKNLVKHKVTKEEIEESFFDLGRKLFDDEFHSLIEERYILIGKTRTKRILFVVFVIRMYKIRVVSARDINKREEHLYEKTA